MENSILRISNNSVSAVIAGCSIGTFAGEEVVVYLDLAPQHPKTVGALWASLVNNGQEWLHINGADQTLVVRGMRHRYHRIAVPAKDMLTGRARPHHFRLVAPEATLVENLNMPFVVLTWSWVDPQSRERRHLNAGTVLAAMLEKYTGLPLLIEWGSYLLTEAEARGHAVPLTCLGNGPAGYVINPAPWDRIISEGLQSGQIQISNDKHNHTEN